MEKHGWQLSKKKKAKWLPVCSPTFAGEDWLIAFSREERAGLDLRGTGVQVHRGDCRNPRLVFTLHPGTNQIRNAAVYQDANILRQKHI